MKWRKQRIVLITVSLITILVIPEKNLEAAISQVCWGDLGIHSIQCANINGTGIQTVVSTTSSPQGLAFDGLARKLYWSQDRPDTGIRRANLDGNSQEIIVNDAADTSAIALDVLNGKIYWIGWTQFGIWRANLDGTNREQLSNYSLVSSGGLVIDPAAGKLYFSAWQWDTGWVGRANLDGSGVEPLVMNLGGPSGMALDLPHGKMFWVSRRDKTIQRANLDGSNVETLVSGLGTPGSVAADSSTGKIYWTDFGTGKIQKANLDGSGVEDLITGLVFPGEIALIESTMKNVAIDIKPGRFPNAINLSSAGVVPVAVFSSATFDATTINPETLTLSSARVQLIGKAGKHACHSEDVNKDGLPDLVCQTQTANFIIQPGQATAILEAETYDGELLRGEDSVTMVP